MFFFCFLLFKNNFQSCIECYTSLCLGQNFARCLKVHVYVSMWLQLKPTIFNVDIMEIMFL